MMTGLFLAEINCFPIDVEAQAAAILTESDSPRLISFGAFVGKTISRMASATRPCPGLMYSVQIDLLLWPIMA
jgi:hypothetical protein